MVSEKARLRVIIEGFLRGDSTQYRILLTKVTQYVNHQCYGSDFDKDDLISEVLGALIDSFRKKRFSGNSIKALNVYIYKIIRNQIGHRVRHRELLSYADEYQELIDEKVRSPEDEAVDKELVRRIYQELDPKCRELLKLKFDQNWSDQEIADSLKKTKNAISTAISRCIKKVQELNMIKEML